MSRRPDRHVLWRISLSAAGLFVLSTMAWLAAVAVVPALVMRWTPVVLTSGSMAPSIGPGDVVVAQPSLGRELGPGTVVVFRDRGKGDLVTHRIVRRHDDGTYTTRGDANGLDDSTPLRAHDIVGVGRLLVPKAGLPAYWTKAGDRRSLTGFALLVAAAAVLLSLDRESGRAGGRRTPGQVRARIHARIPAPATFVGLLVAAAAIVSPSPSVAALAATTANGTNVFTAGAPSCAGGPTTVNLQATADSSVVQDKPTTNFGADATLDVKSSLGKNARAYVRFTLPAMPSGCTVTSASLTLRTTTFRSGRSIQVARAAATWDESTVTWANQPGETGVSIAQPSFNGFMAWSVTPQIQASYVSGNHGLVVRDEAEDAGGSLQNKYSSREGGNPPVLTVTFG